MKRPITVISIISILLFAAALAWFGFGIYADGKEGKEENERVFETLVFKTVNEANTSQVGTPEFSKKFIDAVGKIENYSSLKLEANGKLVYSYPPAGFSLPSAALTNSFKKTNSTKSGLLLTVSASMYAIRTNSVYHYAKFAFVLILLGTSISLVLLVILSGKKENKKSHKQDDSDDEFKFDFGDEEDSDEIFDLPEDDENSSFDLSDLETDLDSADKESGDNIEANNIEDIFVDDEKDLDSYEENLPVETENQESDTPEAAEKEPDLPFMTDISEGDFEIQDDEKTELDWSETLENANKNLNHNDEKTELEPTETENSNENINENSDDKIIEEKADSDFDFNFDLDSPVEQVSPATGLKLQSALLPELDDKIKKSLGNQKELTLALLKVNGLDRGNSISNKIVEILKSGIENAEDIFEYQSDGYAIILENADLALCADIFDKIYEKMTSYLRSSNSTNEVVVGLSSVNGRSVDSERLETEADQALAHALEDPDSPIIAFRANPEKYREYMNN